MSRELPFIDFINECAKPEHGADEEKSSPYIPPSDSDYILSALNCLDEYPEQKTYILRYQETLLKIKSEQDTSVKEILQRTKSNLEVQLHDVIASEKRKAYREAAKRGRESLARYQKMYNQKFEQEQLECNRNLEEEREKPKCNITPKPTTPSPAPASSTPTKTQKIMDILTSKRIAAVFSIILCIALYFALLTNVFTTKIDTLIGYIQEGSEYIHGETYCSRYDGNYGNPQYRLDSSKPVISTTLYDSPDKISCCMEKAKETTITVKDYLSPLFISLPISVGAFMILTFKKKNN